MLSILLQRWENKASIWLSFKTEKLEMGQLLWLIYQSSDPADNDAWKDKGTGQLSIKCKEGVNKGTREFKPTILVRNDEDFLPRMLTPWNIYLNVLLAQKMS